MKGTIFDSSITNNFNHNPYLNKLIGKVNTLQPKNTKPTFQSEISMSPIKPQRNNSNECTHPNKSQDPKKVLNHLIGEYKPYLSVKQFSDAEQWTERVQKPNRAFDKHKSCTNIPDDQLESEDPHFKKYAQLFVLQPHLIPKMFTLSKKLREFKVLKENGHNQYVSTIAKIKCFCLDNSQSVFDFYRCTDLILLKYMVYLLIQELNLRDGQELTQESNQNTNYEQAQNQLKNTVKEVVGIVYEIIQEFSTKQDRSKKTSQAINQLNRQIQLIQQKFGGLDDITPYKPFATHFRLGSSNFDTCTTPQTQIKHINFMNDRISQSSKKHSREIEFQTSPKSNQTKIIQYQIDELNIKNELIQKQNESISNLQQLKKQQMQQITELNQTILTLQQENKNQQIQIEEYQKLQKTWEDSIQNYKKDKDTYFNKFVDLNEEHKQLKILYDDLLKSTNNVHKEYNTLKQQLSEQYNMEINQLRDQRGEEIDSLKKQIQEKQLIISSLLEDANYFGKQIKNIQDKIYQIPSDQLNKDLLSLQRDLYLQENALNSKLNTIQQFQQSIQVLEDVQVQQELGDFQGLTQSHISTSIFSNPLVNQNTNYDQLKQYNTGTMIRIHPFSTGQSRKNSQHTIDQFGLQRQNQDIMQMLLIQCDVIEKLLQ